MIQAMHPFKRKAITPKEFISEFGADYKIKGIFPKCLHCGEDVFTYGTSSIEVTSRFKHHSGKSCNPTHIGEGTITFDFKHGEEVKKEFCETDTICKSYVLCLNMVGRRKFSTNTFLTLCKRADKRNIWSYAGIEVWMIPYILLTLSDLTITISQDKSFQIRFVLDKNFDLLSREKICNIEKIYADSQTMIESFIVSHDSFENIEIGWMQKPLIDKLTSYC